MADTILVNGKTEESWAKQANDIRESDRYRTAGGQADWTYAISFFADCLERRIATLSDEALLSEAHEWMDASEVPELDENFDRRQFEGRYVHNRTEHLR